MDVVVPACRTGRTESDLVPNPVVLGGPMHVSVLFGHPAVEVTYHELATPVSQEVIRSFAVVVPVDVACQRPRLGGVDIGSEVSKRDPGVLHTLAIHDRRFTARITRIAHVDRERLGIWRRGIVGVCRQPRPVPPIALPILVDAPRERAIKIVDEHIRSQHPRHHQQNNSQNAYSKQNALHARYLLNCFHYLVPPS